jgi:glycosyltransferase involved in cell wall biosynthesis
MRRKRILYFRIWALPPISASVERMLRDAFSEYDLEVITLWDAIKADKKTVLLNSLAALREYGKDIILGRLNARAAFFCTVFLFDHVRDLVRNYAGDPENIAFTFQLQSIFDTHLEGIPHFIYTDHTHLANLQYSPQIRVNLYSAEWISKEKTIYDQARMIFTRSNNISRSLIEQYGEPQEKVKCVYAGANTPQVPQAAGKKDYSGKHILFVGMDWERKGGPDLVKAFSRVIKDHPDATLTIVGCRIKTNVSGIISTGKIPVDRLDDYYRRATIFCMPSRSEPFGVVFVEAMAHALPIIATDIGAMPDMVSPGKNGILVKVGDLDGLVTALDELLSSAEKRSRFGRQSLLLARHRYNWQSVGKHIRQAILEAIEE